MSKKERLFIYIVIGGAIALALFASGIHLWKYPAVRVLFARREVALDFSSLKGGGLRKGDLLTGRAIVDYRVYGTFFESRFFRLRRFYIYPLFSGIPELDDTLLLVLKTESPPPHLVDREERVVRGIVIGFEDMLDEDFLKRVMEKVEGLNSHRACLIEEVF